MADVKPKNDTETYGFQFDDEERNTLAAALRAYEDSANRQVKTARHMEVKQIYQLELAGITALRRKLALA